MRAPYARRCIAIALGATALLLACDRAPQFPALASEFVYTSLSFSPSSATQIGLHRYSPPNSRDTLWLDALLDDFSTPSLARQRAYYTEFQTRLAATNRAGLDAQTQADFDLLSDAVAGSLFRLDQERFTERKPQMYPESLGSALFSNISLEYADTATRARQLTARLKQVPAFIRTAQSNLKASNEIYRSSALDEMAGVADLVRGIGAQFVRGTPSQAAYDSAQPAALAAIAAFNAFVKDSLPHLAAFDWRMGRAMFDTKWRFDLQSSITPAEMLKSAEDSMVAIRKRMLVLARPMHDAWFPGHRHATTDSTALINTVVSEVLARIGQEHANRDSLEASAVADVAMLANFVRDKRLISQTDFTNVRVIPTPIFMRASYGVGGAVFAPALEPKLSSFYWVTPIPKEWPAARAESKLREYNRFNMLRLSIHEALPGHLVQGDYANRVTPDWRRLVRAVSGNSAYVEGWAEYITQVLQQEGLYGADSAKAELVALKGMLRDYSNVIIDHKLHTQNMPVDSVEPFLVRDAFEESPEAVAKLQRAQLDYVQLNEYPIGLHEWWATRREAEQREGKAFNLCRFHDAMLSYGPLPVPTARRLYLANVAPSADMPPSRCATAQ